MSEEIKVGDKVRVSKDAPGIYMKTIFPNLVSSNMEVTEIGYGFARIKPLICECEYLTFEFAIPTKYLIKVEDEAKEPKPKYKAGDKVRVLGHALLEGCVFTITLVEHREKRGWMYRINTHTWYSESDLEPYAEPTAPTIKVGDKVQYLPNNTCGIISKCANNHCVIEFNDGLCCCTALENVELVQTKEQMEANANDAAKHCDIPNLSELDRIKVREFIEIHPFDFESLKCGGKVFEDMYWDAYTADLAKEIVVKIVNKNMDSDPEKVGSYAVNLAKSVVEELKRK